MVQHMHPPGHWIAVQIRLNNIRTKPLTELLNEHFRSNLKHTAVVGRDEAHHEDVAYDLSHYLSRNVVVKKGLGK